jgi:diacylglycerol kinase (ATP)
LTQDERAAYERSAATEGGRRTIRPHLLLIPNRHASSFSAVLHRTVVSILGSVYQVTPVWPTSGLEAQQMATRAAAAGFPLVVAMGGDGLVCHVSNGIAGTATALGIVPVGTANMLARSLGLPKGPRAAAELLAGEHALLPIPVVCLYNGEGRLVAKAVSQFGMGFDALVASQIERNPWGKKHMSELLYAATCARVLWCERRRLNNTHLRVHAGDRSHDAAVTVLAQVRWPYAYFGPLQLRLTPTSTEGFDVLIMERCTPRLLIEALSCMALAPARLENVPGLEVWANCEQLVIRAEPATLCQADGELLGKSRYLKASRSADKLLIVAPKRTS